MPPAPATDAGTMPRAVCPDGSPAAELPPRCSRRGPRCPSPEPGAPNGPRPGRGAVMTTQARSSGSQAGAAAAGSTGARSGPQAVPRELPPATGDGTSGSCGDRA